MSLVRATDMLTGTPLPGWSGRFFHSQTMTFSQYEIAEDAVPLHEHHHAQEEVWHVIEGSLTITVAGVEHRAGPGDAVVVPPDVRHSARPHGACRVLVADWPLREHLPGR